jgi:hypothetical protein
MTDLDQSSVNMTAILQLLNTLTLNKMCEVRTVLDVTIRELDAAEKLAIQVEELARATAMIAAETARLLALSQRNLRYYLIYARTAKSKFENVCLKCNSVDFICCNTHLTAKHRAAYHRVTGIIATEEFQD